MQEQQHELIGAKMPVKYALHSSVEAMLTPNSLSELAGTRIRTVRLQPVSDRQGVSGNQLLVVETDSHARFILKRMGLQRDWIMRASNDRRCRSVTLWQSGLLDQLLPDLDHAIIACARDEDGWAILMHDVSGGLLTNDRYIDATANEHILRALAHLHAQFWEAPLLDDPALGLCTMPELIAVTTPGPHSPEKALVALELLPQVYEPDVANTLGQLVTDPQPLCDVLVRYPHTLIHGDFKVTNLAWNASSQMPVVALDWQMAAVGLPTQELGWYFANSYSPPASPQRCIELYHDHLVSLLGSRLNERQWQPIFELGMLVTAVRTCCLAAWVVTHDPSQKRRDNVRKHLPMWSDWVRAGVNWL